MITLEMQPPTCYNLIMSVFISIGILVLSMLILIFLQLAPGVFALTYHYTLGKFSKNTASFLTLFFIIGVEIISTCIFLSTYYLISLLFFSGFQPETSILTWILAGILIALGFLAFFYYYRPGPGTRLFISQKYAKGLKYSAKTIKTKSDAFVLGVMSSVSEFIYTFPLYILASIEIVRLSFQNISINLFALLFVLAPLLPLFIIRYKFQAGYNLADIIKARTKNKFFTRFILSFNYIIIAILILCFRTII